MTPRRPWGSGVEPHVHQLAECHECEHDGPCIYCDGRGYYEVCWICGEPMGNKRRKWKREQRG